MKYSSSRAFFYPTFLCFLVCCLSALLSVQCIAADLLSYVAQPDSTFAWQKTEESTSPLGTRIVFSMTSQTWQSIAWQHKLELFIPPSCEFPDTALMIVAGGNGGGGESQFLVLVANMTKCPVAILHNIPNQPLYGDLHEDSLIAYTFAKALETNDMTWPLLLPMTKSAVRAMDILQAYSKVSLKSEISKFIIGGASKRGWTTWLTAAADPVRVKGIIPMVYDNLNLIKQMDLQLAAYGKYSDEISEYTDIKLQAKLKTPEGKILAKVVDPWSYIKRITMPKLIINAANDPYWNISSMNIYWNDLIGNKSVLYVPNAGHDMGMGNMDIQNVITIAAPMTAFIRSVAKGESLVPMNWKYGCKSNLCWLNIKTATKDTDAKMWVAVSDTRDFRKSKWNSVELKPGKTGFVGSVPLPTKGYLAIFGEVMFPGSPAYSLSTQVGVFDTKGSIKS